MVKLLETILAKTADQITEQLNHRPLRPYTFSADFHKAYSNKLHNTIAMNAEWVDTELELKRTCLLVLLIINKDQIIICDGEYHKHLQTVQISDPNYIQQANSTIIHQLITLTNTYTMLPKIAQS